MEMKTYLADTFKFNETANERVITKINELPDKNESIRLISHMINCHHKWMAGIKEEDTSKMDWWEPVYPYEELSPRWHKCIGIWLDYLEGMNDEMLRQEIVFKNFDGGMWTVKPQDIALQLNYHSIHHRAQIQQIIRAQGVKPDFVDYIRGRFRKVTA
jgi:uncharacterized damage-inducible protein DinB